MAWRRRATVRSAHLTHHTHTGWPARGVQINEHRFPPHKWTRTVCGAAPVPWWPGSSSTRRRSGWMGRNRKERKKAQWSSSPGVCGVVARSGAGGGEGASPPVTPTGRSARRDRRVAVGPRARAPPPLSMRERGRRKRLVVATRSRRGSRQAAKRPRSPADADTWPGPHDGLASNGPLPSNVPSSRRAVPLHSALRFTLLLLLTSSPAPRHFTW